MEVVNTLDIDGTQWELQDVEARNRIAELEKKEIIKIKQIINKDTIKLDIVEIDNEKFIRIRVWGYIWSGKIGETIANFTQDIGLKDTTGCLMDATMTDLTGRLVVHLDITVKGNIEVYPCITSIFSGTYKQCWIYGNGFIKI